MSVNNAFAITFKVHPLTGLFYIIFQDSVNMTSLLSSTHGRRKRNPSAVVLLTRHTAKKKTVLLTSALDKKTRWLPQKTTLNLASL